MPQPAPLLRTFSDSSLTDVERDVMQQLRERILSTLGPGVTDDVGKLTLSELIVFKKSLQELYPGQPESKETNKVSHFPILMLADIARWVSRSSSGDHVFPLIDSNRRRSQLIMRQGGMGAVWNMIGLHDEKLKGEAVEAFAQTLYAGRNNYQNKNGDAHVDPSDLCVQITLEYLKGPDRDSYLDAYSALTDFVDVCRVAFLLSADEQEQKQRTHDLMNAIPPYDTRYSSLAHLWLAPLCHAAYLEGNAPRDIIEATRPIARSLGEIWGLKEDMAVFERRCQIICALGFDELMAELKPTLEDIKALNQPSFDDINFACVRESPLGYPIITLSGNKQDIIFDNHRRSLAAGGLVLDIQGALDIEDHNKLTDGRYKEALRLSPVDLVLRQSPHFEKDLRTTIHHPAWLKSHTIRMRKNRTNNVISDDTLVDLLVACAKRHMVHPTSSAVDIGQIAEAFVPLEQDCKPGQIFPLDLQHKVAMQLIADKAMTADGCEYLGIAPQVLINLRHQLPESMRRHLLGSAFEI